MKLSDVFAVPFFLQMDSIEKSPEVWICKACYPELPDCVVEASNPLDAIEALEEKRLKTILHLIEARSAIPKPREPLKNREFNMTMEPISDKLKRLGLAEWLERLDLDVDVKE